MSLYRREVSVLAKISSSNEDMIVIASHAGDHNHVTLTGL